MHMMNSHRPFGLVSALLLAAVAGAGLQGCAVVGLGAAAVGGGQVMADRRPVGSQADDAGIRVALNDKWLKANVELLKHLDFTVENGEVLLTGVAPSADLRLQAVKLTWEVEGVRDVINEIKLSEGGGLGEYAQDALITNKVKLLIASESLPAWANYEVETVQGVVYLMGTAASAAEATRIRDIAASVARVRQEVSYVRVQPG
jgi:osmotically-inducible protein OsmY